MQCYMLSLAEIKPKEEKQIVGFGGRFCQNNYII